MGKRDEVFGRYWKCGLWFGIEPTLTPPLSHCRGRGRSIGRFWKDWVIWKVPPRGAGERRNETDDHQFGLDLPQGTQEKNSHMNVQDVQDGDKE